MRILLLGSGGREHALAWKLTQSTLCESLFIAPGNAGTAMHGQNVNLSAVDFLAVKQFVLDSAIDMVVVGPEAPLVEGIYDFFLNDEALAHVQVVGPSKVGAQLEGSKAFAKEFMQRHDIPTAAYKEFTKANLADGLAYIDTQETPIVLKADGLAAGKGVLILEDKDEAKAALTEMLAGKFGAASETVVIEAFLSGIEFSVFVVTDGENYQILPEAKDYKRIGEGDQGLNTGGMGAVSPVSFVDATLWAKVEHKIIRPTIEGLKKENVAYKGFIFFGLINVGGEPYVIEYNCRLGDPETEVVLPRLKNDLVELFQSLFDGRLPKQIIHTDSRVATTVMLVSGGYPEAYEKGKVMTEIDFSDKEDLLAFHAGTRQVGDTVQTNGGRVLALTAYGKDLANARDKAMEAAAQVQFEGKFYRTDIGNDLLPKQ